MQKSGTANFLRLIWGHQICVPSAQVQDERIIMGLCCLCPGWASARTLRSDYLFILLPVLQAVPSSSDFETRASIFLDDYLEKTVKLLIYSPPPFFLFWVVMNPLFVQTFQDCKIQVLRFWTGKILFVTLLLIFQPVEVQMKSNVWILVRYLLRNHCNTLWKYLQASKMRLFLIREIKE